MWRDTVKGTKYLTPFRGGLSIPVSALQGYRELRDNSGLSPIFGRKRALTDPISPGWRLNLAHFFHQVAERGRKVKVRDCPGALAVIQFVVREGDGQEATFGGRWEILSTKLTLEVTMAVYSMIESFCNALAAEWRLSQRRNLTLAMHSLFERRSPTLSHLAQHFPMPEVTKVERVKHG